MADTLPDKTFVKSDTTQDLGRQPGSMVSQGGHFGASSCRQTDNPRGCDQTQDQNSHASQSAIAQVDQKESNGQQYGDRRRPDEMQSAA
ncbi:hypothetical protein MGG_16948 [Pyricularia oryzae 70-15]|uniref:Uncharacterized protein n=3 Tax=Pyricularia oryzae TaxID=318829 RepID=G4N1X0_PYRO7|nr:uncharacterized protein MGG_16948 [Pyricularia oryzae 70-15]EHA53280.1 hypothetical protein MGG_16948 [Pyricularia oryzae 70-15]ELQ35012.1 hypothetical protein OOU_Y34scaffold00733g6 [Pyricularia oryzae Y34]